MSVDRLLLIIICCSLLSIQIVSMLVKKRLENISNKLEEIGSIAGDNKDAAMVAAITKNVAIIVIIETIRKSIPKGYEINEADIVAMFQQGFDESLRTYIGRSIAEVKIEATTKETT